MKMETAVVSSADGIRAVRSQVAALFETVFMRPFPECVWAKYYLENPYGSPAATLLFADNMLVGHHALVPQLLHNEDGNKQPYHLSVSLMLHPDYRGLPAFQAVVGRTMQTARELATPFVLGFPNANSFLPLRRLFGWELLMETSLYNWRLPKSGNGIAHRPKAYVEKSQTGTSWRGNGVYWKWRAQCGDYQVQHVAGCSIVTKRLDDDVLMVLDVYEEQNGPSLSANAIVELADEQGAKTIRITGYHASLLQLDQSFLTSHEEYVVRQCIVPVSEQPSHVRFSLLLSDAF